MQRSVFGRAARSAGLLLIAATLLTSCSEKVDPVGPDNLASDGRALLLGTQNTNSVSYTFVDPGTPDDLTDDNLTNTEFFGFAGDSTNAILQILDLSNASLFRPYRREGSNSFQRIYDFDVTAYDRDLRTHVDRFLLNDPGVVGASEYMATGLISGQSTASSPTSAKVKPWGRPDESLPIQVNRVQRDSVLALSFTLDPRAAAYFVEILDFGIPAISRDVALASAGPLPVALTHEISSFLITGPAPGVLHIPTAPVRFTRGFYPRSFVVRVTAVDAGLHVVARSQPDYARRALGRTDDGGNINLYDPMGGYVVLLDPYGAGATYPAVEYFRVQAMLARNASSVTSTFTPYESILPRLQEIARQRAADGYQPVELPGLSQMPPGLLEAKN